MGVVVAFFVACGVREGRRGSRWAGGRRGCAFRRPRHPGRAARAEIRGMSGVAAAPLRLPGRPGEGGARRGECIKPGGRARPSPAVSTSSGVRRRGTPSCVAAVPLRRSWHLEAAGCADVGTVWFGGCAPVVRGIGGRRSALLLGGNQAGRRLLVGARDIHGRGRSPMCTQGGHTQCRARPARGEHRPAVPAGCRESVDVAGRKVRSSE